MGRYTPENHLAMAIDSEAGATRYERDAAHRLAKTVHADGRVDEYRYNAADDNIVRSVPAAPPSDRGTAFATRAASSTSTTIVTT